MGKSTETYRWTSKRKVDLILRVLRGDTTVQEAAREHGITVGEIEDWKEKFFLGAENALRNRPKDEQTEKDEQIKRLKQKIGELVFDIDIIREAHQLRPITPPSLIPKSWR